MSTATLLSPIGPILVESAGDRLSSIRIGGKGGGEGSGEEDVGVAPVLGEAIAQLKAWFDHRLTKFDLPLIPLQSPRGEALRAAISKIPYGNTESYGEVAHRAGSGPRAIGQACRRNPYPIIVPCHRVIGAGQAIGYYSGGDGIATKRWLLEYERTS